MTIQDIYARIKGRCHTLLAEVLFKKPLKMNNAAPHVSFTFDDFPRSALHRGGDILAQHGLRGTYYASFGHMGEESVSGSLFTREDVEMLLARGHELGCHTFDHCHSRETRPEAFEASILKNRQALHEVSPGASFKSLSYPIVGPLADTKRRAGKYFRSCRCGGQTYNVKNADLNLLNAFFLERSKGDLSLVKEVIENNRRERGRLIFATHDIDENPSPYGCTPAFFEEIVKYSVGSGAKILPVDEALENICTGSNGN